MFGERYIKNIEWKETALNNIIAWREEIARIETINKKEVPKNLKKELESLFKSLPVIDINENQLIDLYKVKYQLFAGKLQQYLKESGDFMGKNKHKFRQYKGYTAPEKHYNYGKREIPGSIQERQFNERKFEREERVSTFSVPSMRDEFKAGPQYQKIKETKCSFSKFDPDVVLTRLAFNKITAWCRLLNEEVTALGVVEQEGQDFIVKDFFMFHQIVTGATCEAENAEALIEVMEEVEKHGYDSSKLRCWWHSHNTMGTSPSQQDLKTAEEFAGKSFLISIINNHRGEFNCKINLYHPFEMEISDVSLFVQDEGISQEFIEERKKEIKKYVKSHSFQSTIGFQQHYPAPVPEITQDFGLSDHLINSGNNGQSDDFFPDMEEIKDRVRKGEPLYSACMYENSIRYTWDANTKRYKMYDAQNNELSKEDMKELGAYDYNEEIEELLAEITQETTNPTTQEGA